MRGHGLQVEALVIDAIKAKSQTGKLAEFSDDDRTILRSVQRVVIGKGALHIDLADASDERDGVLQVPWTPRGFRVGLRGKCWSRQLA